MIAIGYPDLMSEFSTVATLSGGSWLAGLPLNNLKNRELSKVARSSDATSTNTKFIIDWGSAKTARALSIVSHNLSSTATIRWKRGSTSGGAEVDDSTALNCWEITPLRYNGKHHNVIVIRPTATSARYDTIEFIDTSNSNGYVELGFPWIGNIFSPTINASYGLKDELVDLSSLNRSESGVLWATNRRKLRQTSFILEWITQAEANTLHELQRVAGTTELVLYVFDTTDRALQQRYGGVGTLSELSAIDYPFINNRSISVKWTEYT